LSLRRHFAISFVVGTALLAAASAQNSPVPLTLPDAVKIALAKNPLHKAALADTRAASADITTARSFLLPHLSFSETATRGDDPVYVFGSRLRQQRFTQADFALNRLNNPLVVESDPLTARMRRASRQQELIRGRNNQALALAQLNAAMGLPIESLFDLTQPLSEPKLAPPVLHDLESLALTSRPDLKRITAEHHRSQFNHSRRLYRVAPIPGNVTGRSCDGCGAGTLLPLAKATTSAAGASSFAGKHRRM
jgi:outer membrane protein TolC